MDIPTAMTPEECKAHLADCNIDGNFCYGLHERGPDEDPHEARLCLATLAAEQHARTAWGIVDWLATEAVRWASDPHYYQIAERFSALLAHSLEFDEVARPDTPPKGG